MGVARAETCLPSAVLAIVLPDATPAAPIPAASTLAIASGRTRAGNPCSVGSSRVPAAYPHRDRDKQRCVRVSLDSHIRTMLSMSSSFFGVGG